MTIRKNSLAAAIVGSLVAGSALVAAVPAAAQYRGNDRHYGNRYDNPRVAQDQCRRAVNARRGLIVNRVSDVDRSRYGYRITGVVSTTYNMGRDNRYERNRHMRRGDRGTFTCTVNNGRVRDVRINGIRGFR